MSYIAQYNDKTKSLQLLEGILMGTVADGILNEAEVATVNAWLDSNDPDFYTFPYDFLYREVKEALKDGVLTKSELEHLLNVFKHIIDPVNNPCDSSPCKKSDKMVYYDISGKTICLTGNFELGTRVEVAELIESFGAEFSNKVTLSTDFLIVGEKGSAFWTNSNYGTKVKSAIGFQSKGSKIEILGEHKFFALINGIDVETE